MGLARYKQKRDFKKTPEPAGRARKKRGVGNLSFVIQKHAASPNETPWVGAASDRGCGVPALSPIGRQPIRGASLGARGFG